jgi:Integrase core domain
MISGSERGFSTCALGRRLSGMYLQLLSSFARGCYFVTVAGCPRRKLNTTGEANRVKLSLDDRALQADLVRADRIVRSRASLEIEILALRHQLNILRRRSPKKLTLSNIDRLVFAGLYRWERAILDANGAYGYVFRNRLKAMGIRDRPISPRSPWLNGYVERLIGTLRRECLDQMLIFGEAHLRQILTAYVFYYNQSRTHLSFHKDAPLGRAIQRYGTIAATPVMSGLHHRYVRI